MVLAAFGLIAVGAAGFWWFSQAPDSSSGTPRLVVDRTEVNLGYLPFEAPARVVFALTNIGDGPLRLVGIPPVRALKGC
ncbi:MAG: hypothetical protein ACE5JD_16310 [Candidatus Methylomirabilia bacterium]